MALTTGAQAASATPATDQYNLLATALTNAGWTNRADMSAATGGTTAVNKVWTSPDTTVASNVYTGTIVFIEVDDTNTRLRFRVAEKYDSAAAGAPANSVKWAAPGNSQGSAQTPTANYGFDDNFIALFQTAGINQKVGWVNIPVSAAGFYYWLGVNASKLVYANNSGGQANHVVLGRIEYLGSAGGAPVVFLIGNSLSTTTGNGSWTIAATAAGNVRYSREPLTTVSTVGPFTGVTGPASAGYKPNTIDGGEGLPHHWFPTYIVFPAYIHGTDTNGYGTQRTCLSTLSEFVVHEPGVTASYVATIGDEVTVGGVTYTSLGISHYNQTSALSVGALLVDGSQF